MIEMQRYGGSRDEYNRLKVLYLDSFPREERLPFWYLVRKTKKAGVELFSLYDGSDFIGLMHTVVYGDIVLIWYFALSSKVQGQGYGSAVLQHVREMYQDKRLILNIEIDDPASGNYEQRKRRKQFYLKNGYETCGLFVKEAGVVFEMLCLGGSVVHADYEAILRYYFGTFICELFLKEVKQ